ncbi:uncharacterized protein RJT21DRAFT_25886 [Scheffersomyces amazonensis]|uniref:uncharacterized protein n=1 Tax=Scheffersomyces amazonensis TaxID=1078765 RepID=UPI00315C78AD
MSVLTRWGVRGRISTSIAWNRVKLTRRFSNIQVPFQDDLSGMENDDLNLGDFQHYKESPDVITKKLEFIGESQKSQEKIVNVNSVTNDEVRIDLETVVSLKEPVVFVSKLSNPYINLAIEDYIYHKMPKPEDINVNYNRLMFYVNSPCVVIGKNQNPWKEVNLPLLNSLSIPLVRRRSGGGTVVHDLGNVNYSFMTTKEKFDRFTFANLVTNAVNSIPGSKYSIEVNERGDITTKSSQDGINYKVSGSAYKLSKGKSYHHGTMLLNSRLDILGKLLHRDESKLGIVDASNSIDSVKSKVTNLELTQEQFIQYVSDKFSDLYGTELSTEETQKVSDNDEYDQDELFGLKDFVQANTINRISKIVTVDETTKLPLQVFETAKELKKWSWRFGSTPKFTHELNNEKFGFKIKFHIDKHGHLETFELDFIETENRLLSIEKINESFAFLDMHIKNNKLKYTGSDVAGFITNDIISDWVGQSIDGTI